MKKITVDPNLVAYCGIYCGACKRYLKGGCPGCHETEKMSWCKIRACCIENNYSSCAVCKEFENPNNCKKYNNFFSKIFAIVFNSDRSKCITQIKEIGMEEHAKAMVELGRPSMKR